MLTASMIRVDRLAKTGVLEPLASDFHPVTNQRAVAAQFLARGYAGQVADLPAVPSEAGASAVVVQSATRAGAGPVYTQRPSGAPIMPIQKYGIQVGPRLPVIPQVSSGAPVMPREQTPVARRTMDQISSGVRAVQQSARAAAPAAPATPQVPRASIQRTAISSSDRVAQLPRGAKPSTGPRAALAATQRLTANKLQRTGGVRAVAQPRTQGQALTRNVTSRLATTSTAEQVKAVSAGTRTSIQVAAITGKVRR